MTQTTVEIDQNCYNIIREKLPWATEDLADFAQSAIAEKTERLLVIITASRGEKA